MTQFQQGQRVRLKPHSPDYESTELKSVCFTRADVGRVIRPILTAAKAKRGIPAYLTVVEFSKTGERMFRTWVNTDNLDISG